MTELEAWMVWLDDVLRVVNQLFEQCVLYLTVRLTIKISELSSMRVHSKKLVRLATKIWNFSLTPSIQEERCATTTLMTLVQETATTALSVDQECSTSAAIAHVGPGLPCFIIHANDSHGNSHR